MPPPRSQPTRKRASQSEIEAAGLVDAALNGLYWIDDSSARDKLFVLSIVDIRTRLLAVDSQIEASNDPYLFVRESYLQRREYLIYDGDPPEDDFFEDEFFDEEFEE